MLSSLYRPNLTLLTDLYQLTMAYGYWQQGLYNRNAIFHLFYRKNPFKGNYAVFAGLEAVIDWLENFRFEPDMIQYLGQLKGNDGRPLFDESFLNYLQRLEFSCDIDAVPEGTAVQPHMPLIRIRGPLLQAQLMETALLNMINFSTLIATKAARICYAAQGDTVLEFGLRRAQGPDGAISASRAAFIGGCDATSNVLAGKLFGIPVKGTHAHSWVMVYESELEAFMAYAKAMPNNSILLVDTYDTIEGVHKAIQVGQWLKTQGAKLAGIRLDSGNLLQLSIEARQILDAAGFQDTKIVASNDLDEYAIRDLKKGGSPIEVWGIGTRLVTAFDQPALGGVYKLAALESETGEWDYKVKLSEQAIKTSTPGALQARLFKAADGTLDYLIYDDFHPPHSGFEGLNWETKNIKSFNFEAGNDLLVPIFEKGKKRYQTPSIAAIRQYALKQVQTIENSSCIGLFIEKNLSEKRATLIQTADRKITP